MDHLQLHFLLCVSKVMSFLICYQNVSHQLMIKAVDGKELPVVTVFSKALQYMKTTVLDYLNKQVENPARSILWIVTVPAIWSQAAKQVMRMAAEEVRDL